MTHWTSVLLVVAALLPRAALSADSEQLLIEDECRKLGVRYAQYIDLGDARKVADLFAEDGVWQTSTSTYTGAEEIQSALRAFQESAGVVRHVITNQLVTLISERRATGVSYFTLYVAQDRGDGKPASLAGQPIMVGVYEDEYVLTKAGWRFARRVSRPGFVRSDED